MILAPLALLLSSTLAASPVSSPAVSSLVAAEYAFADQVEKEGIRKGFLGALRDDGVVFLPRAVNGPSYYKTKLEMGALLKAYPSLAEVSQGGDLGYCTGPWEFQNAKNAPVSAQGWFVTLWQRDGQGPWKVRLDIGTATPNPEGRPVPAPLPRSSASPLPPGAPLGNGAELLDLDRAFSKDASRNAAAAYSARIDPAVRFYRKGRFPVEGAKALVLALDPGTVSWEPTEAFVSASGDLGCTRGTLRHHHPDGETTSQYVRMWKKQGTAWKLALDLELALPVQ
jgi:ketosteroid isomerase-like protein